MSYKKVFYGGWDEAQGARAESAYAKSMFENLRCQAAVVTVLKAIAEGGAAERLEKDLFSRYGTERVSLVLSATIRRDDEERKGDDGISLNSPSSFSDASYDWARRAARLRDDSMERAVAVPGFSYFREDLGEIVFAEAGTPDFYRCAEALREDLSAFSTAASYPERERGRGGEIFASFSIPLSAYRGESGEGEKKTYRFAMPSVGEYLGRDCTFSALASNCSYDEKSGRFTVRLPERETQRVDSPHTGDAIYRSGGQIGDTVYHIQKDSAYTGPFPASPLDLAETETLERAFRGEGGEKFRRLYNGEDMAKNRAKSARMLLDRLAIRFSGVEEVLKVFSASGFAGESGVETLARRAVSNARRLAAAQRPAARDRPRDLGDENGK